MTYQSYSSNHKGRRTRNNGGRRQTEESVNGVQRRRGGKWYKSPAVKQEKKSKAVQAENSTNFVATRKTFTVQTQRKSQQKRIPDWDCPKCGMRSNFGSRKSCRGCSFANPAWITCGCGESNHPNRESCFYCGSDVHRSFRTKPLRRVLKTKPTPPPSVYAESLSSENLSVQSTVSSSSCSYETELDMEFFTPGRSYYMLRDTEVLLENAFPSRHDLFMKLQEDTRVFVDRFETISCVPRDELIIRAHITSPARGWFDLRDEAGQLVLSKTTPTHI